MNEQSQFEQVNTAELPALNPENLTGVETGMENNDVVLMEAYSETENQNKLAEMRAADEVYASEQIARLKAELGIADAPEEKVAESLTEKVEKQMAEQHEANEQDFIKDAFAYLGTLSQEQLQMTITHAYTINVPGRSFLSFILRRLSKEKIAMLIMAQKKGVADLEQFQSEFPAFFDDAMEKDLAAYEVHEGRDENDAEEKPEEVTETEELPLGGLQPDPVAPSAEAYGSENI